MTASSGRMHYSRDEDCRLYSFVYGQLKSGSELALYPHSIELWKLAATKRITTHSWQSMRDRFRRILLKRLPITTDIRSEVERVYLVQRLGQFIRSPRKVARNVPNFESLNGGKIEFGQHGSGPAKSAGVRRRDFLFGDPSKQKRRTMKDRNSGNGVMSLFRVSRKNISLSSSEKIVDLNDFSGSDSDSDGGSKTEEYHDPQQPCCSSSNQSAAIMQLPMTSHDKRTSQSGGDSRNQPRGRSGKGSSSKDRTKNMTIGQSAFDRVPTNSATNNGGGSSTEDLTGKKKIEKMLIRNDCKLCCRKVDKKKSLSNNSVCNHTYVCCSNSNDAGKQTNGKNSGIQSGLFRESESRSPEIVDLMNSDKKANNHKDFGRGRSDSSRSNRAVAKAERPEHYGPPDSHGDCQKSKIVRCGKSSQSRASRSGKRTSSRFLVTPKKPNKKVFDFHVHDDDDDHNDDDDDDDDSENSYSEATDEIVQRLDVTASSPVLNRSLRRASQNALRMLKGNDSKLNESGDDEDDDCNDDHDSNDDEDDEYNKDDDVGDRLIIDLDGDDDDDDETLRSLDNSKLKQSASARMKIGPAGNSRVRYTENEDKKLANFLYREMINRNPLALSPKNVAFWECAETFGLLPRRSAQSMLTRFCKFIHPKLRRTRFLKRDQRHFVWTTICNGGFAELGGDCAPRSRLIGSKPTLKSRLVAPPQDGLNIVGKSVESSSATASNHNDVEEPGCSDRDENSLGHTGSERPGKQQLTTSDSSQIKRPGKAVLKSSHGKDPKKSEKTKALLRRSVLFKKLETIISSSSDGCGNTTSSEVEAICPDKVKSKNSLPHTAKPSVKCSAMIGPISVKTSRPNQPGYLPDEEMESLQTNESGDFDPVELCDLTAKRSTTNNINSRLNKDNKSNSPESSHKDYNTQHGRQRSCCDRGCGLIETGGSDYVGEADVDDLNEDAVDYSLLGEKNFRGSSHRENSKEDQEERVETLPMDDGVDNGENELGTIGDPSCRNEGAGDLDRHLGMKTKRYTLNYTSSSMNNGLREGLHLHFESDESGDEIVGGAECDNAIGSESGAENEIVGGGDCVDDQSLLSGELRLLNGVDGEGGAGDENGEDEGGLGFDEIEDEDESDNAVGGGAGIAGGGRVSGGDKVSQSARSEELGQEDVVVGNIESGNSGLNCGKENTPHQGNDPSTCENDLSHRRQEFTILKNVEAATIPDGLWNLDNVRLQAALYRRIMDGSILPEEVRPFSEFISEMIDLSRTYKRDIVYILEQLSKFDGNVSALNRSLIGGPVE